MFESTAAGLGLNEQQSNHNSVIKAQAHIVQEHEKIRERRPVENSEESPEPKPKEHGKSRTKTTIDENNVIVVERYNEEGELVNKTPPGYVPLSETL
ncbi:MAG: hypothetical protein JRL30_14690 [Deltaproteobacteria bacterium]|jgi:hypothetical protein|nr:hypothetical protein [Deltaproteobacteria bacterium]